MRRGLFLFLFLCGIAAASPAAAETLPAPACGIFSASYKYAGTDSANNYSLTIEPKAEKLNEGATLATFHFRKQESREGIVRAYSKSLDYRCHTAPRAGCRLGVHRLAALDEDYNAVNFLEEALAPAFLLITGQQKAYTVIPVPAILPDERLTKHLLHTEEPATLWVFDRCLEP